MYMIWLATVMNGQQRPLTVPTILVLAGEAVTFTATTPRAVAATSIRALDVTTFLLGHFYTCRTDVGT